MKEETQTACDTCSSDTCSAKRKKEDETEQEFAQRQRLESRLCRIDSKIIILSGKGGVGKSTVAVNLAVALALEGLKVGLLDVDIHGPSIPTMLGLEKDKVQGGAEGFYPPQIGNMKVMSLGFLLPDPDIPVIWRGPLKMGAIKQFLSDVEWGILDYLIIDAPPGTGDEPLSVCQLIQPLDGAIIVTTPQRVAAVDVRKAITFCHQLSVPVLGVVENMSSFVCPHCGKETAIFSSGAGESMAKDFGVSFLGHLPIDPQITKSGDEGKPFIYHFSESPSARNMREIVKKITDFVRGRKN